MTHLTPCYICVSSLYKNEMEKCFIIRNIYQVPVEPPHNIYIIRLVTSQVTVSHRVQVTYLNYYSTPQGYTQRELHQL